MTAVDEVRAQAETVPAEPVVITEPGVYPDLDEVTYHSDPVPGIGSLSNSGAKRLLPPSVPAIFKWERDHGRPDKRAFDFGHAAHKLVLGVGAEIVAVNAEDWRTKAAKDAAKEARAGGKVPLLAREVAEVQAMAAALREHPIAAKLLEPGSGRPEVSAFWKDPTSGITLRSRYDWLPYQREDGRLIVPDYKSTTSASPSAIAKHAADFAYFMQDPWYSTGLRELGYAADPAFVFIFQEKTPPYLVNVVELDPTAKAIGERRMRIAIEIFRDCAETDLWPGYGNEVDLIRLPAWFEARALNEEF